MSLILQKENTMSNYCETVDKNTGDKVNWASGCLFWVCVAGLITCAIGRGCQEYKKHAEKSNIPSNQVITNTVQNVR